MKIRENRIETYDRNMRPDEANQDNMKWHSPKRSPFHVSGLAWFAEEGKYRRLPTAPKAVLPAAVDYLANHPAGGQIRFQTDSPSLSVRVKLADKANMFHMPATGQCGVDCYIETSNGLQYCNTTKYDSERTEYDSVLFQDWHSEMRNIVLYLPLYKGVEEIEIGLEESASILPPSDYLTDKKIIIYGTSITQGGCASRPGMAYSNILSRRIPMEFLNLGFSGSGKGEAEVAEVIASIPNPACLVLDYEANCVSTELFQQTLPEFIQIYRSVHPQTKVLVVSKIRYAREIFPDHRELYQTRMECKQFQQSLVHELRSKGDPNIFFIDGSDLLGSDFHECTVDGTHPTDLGFLRMADRLEPIFKSLLL